MFRFKSFIGGDTIKPVIAHTPADYYFETEDSIKLTAEVSDNIGIDSVFLEYRINDNISSYAGMKADSSGYYSVVLTSAMLNWSGGDSLRYRIFARDSAGVANITILPDSGYYSIGIEGFGPVITSYATDFSNAESDFFLSGFEITRPIGFLKSGLHSDHPYESPDEADRSLNFIAMLRNPLKFDQSGMLIEFSDIALVEPGETGALFGSDDFYDYVVVEGSKDFGKTWQALWDGYDARYNSTWLKTYNNSIVDQNSTSLGKESMFIQHTEYMASSARFKTGDTVLIRFRLYSDPFAHGWGWAIQDLKINPLIDGIEKPLIETLKLFPNPGRGLIQISDGSGILSNGESVKFEVFNSSGVPVLKGLTINGNDSSINLTGYPSGLYIVVLYLDDGIRTFKYSLIK
jgi:hypothetical protein